MYWQSTLLLLIRIGEGSSVIILAILWAREAKTGLVFRCLSWYLFIDSIIYIFDLFARKVLHTNIFIFHVSTFSDVTFLSIIFLHLASYKGKLYIKLCWFIFLCSAIISAAWIDGIMTNLNTFSRITGNSILVFMGFRQLISMIQYEYLAPPSKNPVFIYCITVIIYYSSTIFIILAQDLPRYTWLHMVVAEKEIQHLTLSFYPLLRAIQFGLLLHLITLFPMGITPRHALPRWLRFRLGWRPPTKN